MAQDTQDNPDPDARRPLAGFAKGTFEVRDDFGDDVELVATPRQAGALDAAKLVADTLLARRDIEREINSGRMFCLPTNTQYWEDLMVRERDARVANDKAVAEYRAALTADTGAKP